MAFDIFITTKYFIVYSLLHVLFDSWISLLSKLVIIENWVKNHTSSVLLINLTDRKFFMRLEIIQAF